MSEIKLYNQDCMKLMKTMENNSVDFIFTDIPYDGVNRESNGLRKLDMGDADIITFNLNEFLNEAYRIVKNGIFIFCEHGQVSTIANFFENKKGTYRVCVWEKTNPSPMNGQYVYLSGIELAIWFKKPGTKSFSAHCKNTVFRYPIVTGKKRFHPTQKHTDMIKEILLDNTKEGETIFDPCMGSGSTGVAALELKRNFIGCELNEEWFKQAENILTNLK